MSKTRSIILCNNIGISSLSYKDDLSFNFDKITNTETLPDIKLKIGSLMDKYTAYGIITKHIKNIISKEISNAVMATENTNISPRLRYGFLNYRDGELSYSISTYMYENKAGDIIEQSYYINILKLLLRLENNFKDDIYAELQAMFDNGNLMLKMNIADIFNLMGKDEADGMFTIIREEEAAVARQVRAEAAVAIQDIDGVHYEDDEYNVYRDSQNVHNSNVNYSVLKASYTLINLLEDRDYTFFSRDEEAEIIAELCKIDPSAYKVIDSIFTRIQTDTSYFIYHTKEFRLYSVFVALWRWINKHENSKDLKLRLLEEMKSMDGYCSTGHLARIINVIQGYTDDENLSITIEIDTAIKSIIKLLLDTSLEDAPDEIMDSMIDDDKMLFLEFIRDIINNNLDRLTKEHGPIKNIILECVKTYTDHSGWTMLAGQFEV